MSQFPQPGYYDPNAIPTTPRKSGLAVTSLVMSLIGIIPCLGLITAPLGVLLGLIGLVSIKPPKTGKGMCAAAVLLGILFTGAQAYLGKKYLIDPIRGYIEYAMTGPQDALKAGFGGDTTGFKAAFYGAGATASDAEAEAFIAELRNRYGEFQSAALPQQQQSGMSTRPQPGQPAVPFPYDLTFTNKSLSGEVELVFADQSTGTFMKKLGYIKVIDPEKGNLEYPPAPGSSNTPPATAPNG